MNGTVRVDRLGIMTSAVINPRDDLGGKLKLCTACRVANDGAAKFCKNCGGESFVTSLKAPQEFPWRNRLQGYSNFHLAIYVWAVLQLLVGLLGILYAQSKLSSASSLTSGSGLEAIGEFNTYSGIFNWGIGLLALSLALSAIQDFLRNQRKD